MPDKLVRDWMTPKPIIVSPNSPLRDAYWLMIDNKVRRLPVMEDNQLVGIITESDIFRAFVELGEKKQQAGT